jgi:SREBP cleavage-activation protein with sterol-sensing domain
MLLTSTTGILAFGLGALSVFPGVQSFCVFALISIATTYVLTVTLLAAVIALDLNRQVQ